MLGSVGIRACQQDSPLRVVRARRPDLLSVDYPLVAIAYGARAQRGEVGTSSGLAEELTPDILTTCDAREPARFLCFAAVHHEHGADHADCDRHEVGGRPELRFLLVPDHALERALPAAAVLARPSDAGPARLGLARLPGDGRLQHPRLAAVRETGTPLAGGERPSIRFEPLTRCAAIGGFLRAVVEVHGRSVSAAKMPLRRCWKRGGRRVGASNVGRSPVRAPAASLGAETGGSRIPK